MYLLIQGKEKKNCLSYCVKFPTLTPPKDVVGLAVTLTESMITKGDLVLFC